MAKKRTSRQRKNTSQPKTPPVSDAIIRQTEQARTRDVVRGLELDGDDIERSLLLGQNQDAIASVVGEEHAEELRGLAREANQVRSRGGKRVLILPGILGSTLAVDGNTVWFDPIDIARGKLALLALGASDDKVESNGVFWPTYTELYLKLRIAGFRPEYFHFDWRKPIADAGKRLAELIEKEASGNQPISLVAHSMGGLVCRSAIKQLETKAESLISQSILLGTPNFGSFAPAMVMTNDYSTVQWMEKLDLVNPAGSLATNVFSTFIGLTEMLPEAGRSGETDLFKTESYPTGERSVRSDVLKKADGLQARLAGGSDKIWMFAGTGLETVVGVTKSESDQSKFEYQLSPAGDETVPLAFAELPGARHRYCKVSHGKLPRNNEVIRATIDVLANGSTSLLHATPDAAVRSISPPISPAIANRTRLQRADQENRRGLGLNDGDLQAALEPLLAVEAPADTTPPSVASLLPSSQPIVIGRKYQNRLDLRLTFGDIGDAQGRAIMLGLFKDVRPGGAAGAIDERLGGMLAEVVDRRMFSANVGELFVLPTPRHGLAAEMVVLIGLGSFSQFSMKSLRSSVENAVRTLLRCQVDELVTVPLGGGSGLQMEQIAEAMVEGVQAALQDSQGRPSLRSLGITTKFQHDYDRLCQGILTLASSSKFDGLEFTLEREVKPLIDRRLLKDPHTVLVTNPNTTYLIIRESPNPESRQSNNESLIDVSILGTGAKATVLSGSSIIVKTDIEKLLEEINVAQGSNNFFAKSTALGERLSQKVLPSIVREALASVQPNSLTVINDLWGSRLPWEILTIGDWKAGLDGNLSRKYSTSNISVAKWLHQRRAASDLKMLLVVNPTSDLSGADKEGKRIRELAKSHPSIHVTEIWESAATKTRLAKEFASGEYDLVHYAGHAYFDKDDRSLSGILCSGDQVLSGRDLATLDSLPSLVVFNACETARVRSGQLPNRMSKPRSNAKNQAAPMAALVDRNVSMAEAFLRGGVGAFIGTYWEVGDAAASTFADVFYSHILQSQSVGDSLGAARQELYHEEKPDWLNYIHYGDPAFRVKTFE